MNRGVVHIVDRKQIQSYLKSVMSLFIMFSLMFNIIGSTSNISDRYLVECMESSSSEIDSEEREEIAEKEYFCATLENEDHYGSEVNLESYSDNMWTPPHIEIPILPPDYI